MQNIKQNYLHFINLRIVLINNMLPSNNKITGKMFMIKMLNKFSIILNVKTVELQYLLIKHLIKEKTNFLD
jgi:hypothetical protein